MIRCLSLAIIFVISRSFDECVYVYYVVQVRRRAGERGVLKNIVVAMEEHSDDEALLLHACTALTNLLHNSMENRSRWTLLIRHNCRRYCRQKIYCIVFFYNLLYPRIRVCK